MKPLDPPLMKDLVCWCSPLPCHADVLLRPANEDIETKPALRKIGVL